MMRYPTWLLGEPEKLNGVGNPHELIYLGDDSIHIVNDVVAMRLHVQRTDGGAPAPLTARQISLQIESAKFFYRDVALRPITAVPAEK